jgi:quinate dehydrogenase
MQTSFDCSQIYIVNWDADEVQAIIQQFSTCSLTENIIHVTTVAQARILAPPGAIVSAVPDIAPVTENKKMAREVLKVFLSSNDKGALLEMCYHPSPNT